MQDGYDSKTLRRIKWNRIRFASWPQIRIINHELNLFDTDPGLSSQKCFLPILVYMFYNLQCCGSGMFIPDPGS
jgi:hypothetical protein